MSNIKDEFSMVAAFITGLNYREYKHFLKTGNKEYSEKFELGELSRAGNIYFKNNMTFFKYKFKLVGGVKYIVLKRKG